MEVTAVSLGDKSIERTEPDAEVPADGSQLHAQNEHPSEDHDQVNNDHQPPVLEAENEAPEVKQQVQDQINEPVHQNEQEQDPEPLIEHEPAAPNEPLDGPFNGVNSTDSVEKSDEENSVSVNDNNSDDNSKEEEDYDPEIAFNHDQEKSKKSSLEDLSAQTAQEPDSQDDEDDYDPEVSLKVKIPDIPPSNTISRPPVGLPPKPQVNATMSHPKSHVSMENKNQLQEAYEAIMQSDLVKDPNFINLPQAEQMKLIVEKLNAKNVHLNSANNSKMNFDQVYSYNKPFKNLKDPIPLIPINEYCRRPNITAPMSPEEEEAYHEFIQREAYYMKLQNWDEFPDKLRLFIGNLPANTISKQDLFRIFSQYGEVIQIAIKAGYGFAQFRTSEACLDCIKGETQVPLHNKIMRLDASKPQKSRKGGRPEVNNPNMGARGREREEEDLHDNKRRRSGADCQVYITGKSSVFFIRKVKKAFANAQITINTEDVTYKEIQDVISEAAYSGVLGTCVINELKVDVQTFESSPDGGIKFDEYADIEPEVAAEILVKAKQKKYGSDMPPYYPQSTNYNDHAGAYGQEDDYGHGHGASPYGLQRRAPRRDGPGGRYSGWGPQGGMEPQPYGQPPPQYGLSYREPNHGYNQTGSRYGNQGYNKYNPPPQAQYDSYQPRPPQHLTQPDQQQLVQQLQNLDPQSMQSMLSMLQQNQQPQQSFGQSPNVPSQQPYGGYERQYGMNQPNVNPQANQVNALLSQLQQNPTASPQQGQNPGSTQSLMETLARLSRK